MNKAYMIAVVICAERENVPRGTLQNVVGKKYHDIMNVESRILKFLRFAKSTFPDAQYVNFYYKCTNKSEKGRNYAFRRYVSEVS
jgi:hypothetical protein